MFTVKSLVIFLISVDHTINYLMLIFMSLNIFGSPLLTQVIPECLSDISSIWSIGIKLAVVNRIKIVSDYVSLTVFLLKIVTNCCLEIACYKTFLLLLSLLCFSLWWFETLFIIFFTIGKFI